MYEKCEGSADIFYDAMSKMPRSGTGIPLNKDGGIRGGLKITDFPTIRTVSTACLGSKRVNGQDCRPGMTGIFLKPHEPQTQADLKA